MDKRGFKPRLSGSSTVFLRALLWSLSFCKPCHIPLSLPPVQSSLSSRPEEIYTTALNPVRFPDNCDVKRKMGVCVCRHCGVTIISIAPPTPSCKTICQDPLFLGRSQRCPFLVPGWRGRARPLEDTCSMVRLWYPPISSQQLCPFL